MNYEIEFHPVGDASKAGDAISIRYGTDGDYQVIVVDGGTDDAGDDLVAHITRFYGPHTVIEHIISTHPDADHACGLRAVFKNFEVNNLWIHGVWHHAEEMLPYFAQKSWTVDGLAKKIRSEYSVVQELLELAEEQGTAVYEPFQGEQIGPFTVMSPQRWSYLRLVPQFRRTPEADSDALAADEMVVGPSTKGLGQLFKSLIERAVSWIAESWNIEYLKEDAVTAAENETSTVLYGAFGDFSVVLTGDAGVNALTWAMDYADSQGISLADVDLIQVPHHGSRSNVTPSLLDRLLGPILLEGSPARKMAVVSVPKDDASHPRKMVVNAFRRRGAPVHKTQGAYFRKHSGMPVRSNEVAAVPFEFFTQVEGYD
jgi:beta-lactamase superfamily II metal-dependent hydrolase